MMIQGENKKLSGLIDKWKVAGEEAKEYLEKVYGTEAMQAQNANSNSYQEKSVWDKVYESMRLE